LIGKSDNQYKLHCPAAHFETVRHINECRIDLANYKHDALKVGLKERIILFKTKADSKVGKLVLAIIIFAITIFIGSLFPEPSSDSEFSVRFLIYGIGGMVAFLLASSSIQSLISGKVER
jgi:hypothetical protein